MTGLVEIIGHRGARGLFPENTLDGFRDAMALGVRAFELDVGMTADGVVVVCHDLTLNPAITRDAAGRYLSGEPPLLRAVTFEALREYDVGRIRSGSVYGLTHRAQRPRDGARIPALEAVLAACPNARFIIELKTDPRHPDRTVAPAVLADATLAVVDRAGAANRVVIESFDWRGPLHVRRTRPAIRLAWLTRAETVRDAALWWDGQSPAEFRGSVAAAVAAQGGGTWAPEWDTLSLPAVAEAHASGLQVIPWTVNRSGDMRRLIGWGVDGLITDRPDRGLLEIAISQRAHSVRS